MIPPVTERCCSMSSHRGRGWCSERSPLTQTRGFLTLSVRALGRQDPRFRGRAWLLLFLNGVVLAPTCVLWRTLVGSFLSLMYDHCRLDCTTWSSIFLQHRLLNGVLWLFEIIIPGRENWH